MSADALPSGWSQMPLVRTALPGKTGFNDGDWVESPYITDSGIRLIQTGNIGIGEFLEKPDSRKFISERSFKLLGCKWVRPGDLLICRMADPIGRACVVPEHVGDSITAVDCTIYRPAPDKADRGYMLHRLNSAWHLREAADTAGGSTRQRISRSNLGGMIVPLPPLPEQRRIAEILDTLDEAIRKTEQVIAKLQQMKQGLLHDLLTRGIDEHGELRDPERHPEQFEDSPLGRIPGGWEVVPIVAYGSGGPSSVVNGPFGSDLLTSELRAKGVPVIYIRDVRENRYRRVSVVHVTPKKARSLSFCDVRRGDVLVAKVGTPPCIAAPYLLESGAIVTQDVIRVRVEVDSDAVFLSGLLNSSLGRAAIRKISVGGTRERVSLTDFKRVRLPKPQDDERREIGNRIASLLEQEDCLHAEDQKLRTLKQGLMDDLLTGRVRVSAPTEATP